MTGHCHCGAITVTVPRRPDYLHDCNCSLCTRSGALWGYYAAGDVDVVGETSSYVRGDRDRNNARVHFCGHCGSTTHWSAESAAAAGYAGVNMRLVDASEIAGVELRFPNGRDWQGDAPFGYVRAPGVFGA